MPIRRRKSDTWQAIAFLSPTLVVFGAFVLFPVVFSFYLSFHDWSMFGGEPSFVGLENYSRLLTDGEFWSVFKNTGIYTVATVPLNMAFALWVAVSLEGAMAGKRWLRAAFFTPVVISAVSAAVIWRWVFDPNLGLMNFALEWIGIGAINWLNDPGAAMASLVIVGVWKSFGINMVLFSAGLAGIPERYYEAARIDGAGKWSQFWHITLPLLSPTMLFVLVLSVIGSFQVFDLVYVLTYGGPLGSTEVLVFYLYEHAFRLFEMGYASAVAYLLFAVLFVLTMLQIRFFRARGHNAV